MRLFEDPKLIAIRMPDFYPETRGRERFVEFVERYSAWEVHKRNPKLSISQIKTEKFRAAGAIPPMFYYLMKHGKEEEAVQILQRSNEIGRKLRAISEGNFPVDRFTDLMQDLWPHGAQFEEVILDGASRRLDVARVFIMPDNNGEVIFHRDNRHYPSNLAVNFYGKVSPKGGELVIREKLFDTPEEERRCLENSLQPEHFVIQPQLGEGIAFNAGKFLHIVLPPRGGTRISQHLEIASEGTDMPLVFHNN